MFARPVPAIPREPGLTSPLPEAGSRSTACAVPLDRGEVPIRASYFFRVSRTSSGSARVKNMTSSPVTVLMSWCRLTTLDAGDLLDHRLQERPRRLDQMGPHLLEQVPPLLGRERLDQMLFGGGQHALEADHEEITDQVRGCPWVPGPCIPARSDVIPSQMAASISPCVLMVTSPTTPGAGGQPGRSFHRTAGLGSPILGLAQDQHT